jgi:1-deoxy-D-xylulose-5-phosphate reductoisomerase
MILAVQYAMSYPERWESGAPACRLPDWGRLSFEEPDHDVFPALRLAYRAGEKGGTAPIALNAADEVAVEAFLAGRLPFTEIIPLVAEVLERTVPRPVQSLAEVSVADAEARETARALLAARVL